MNYVEKSALARMIRDSQAAGRPTDELVDVMRLMVDGILGKCGLKSRVDLDVVLAEFVLVLLRPGVLARVDPPRAFAYLTTVCYNCVRAQIRPPSTRVVAAGEGLQILADAATLKRYRPR